MSLLLRQGFIILHDNGGPHTANRICDCLRYWSWEVVQCHLDLASSDSHLFGPRKKRLGWQGGADVKQPVAGVCLCLTPISSKLQYKALGGGGGGKCLKASDG
jgi:hypothetical protein